MATGIGVILIAALATLTKEIGHYNTKVKIRNIFVQPREVNVLSAARVFLFGARDVWFVVALPVFLHETLSWSFTEVGTFMALWVIAYGAAQTAAPTLTQLRTGGKPPNGQLTVELSTIMAGCILAIVAAPSG